MPKQGNLYATKAYNSGGATFASADGTTIKDLISAGVDDSRIIGISITSSDSAARDILLYLNNGTTDLLLGHVDIPALAGFDGVINRVNGMNSTNLPGMLLDSVGNIFYPIKGGHKLRAAMKVAATSGATITVVAIAEDY